MITKEDSIRSELRPRRDGRKSRYYIFNCKNSCGGVFGAVAAQIYKFSGYCRRCSNSINSKKRKYITKTIKAKFSYVYYLQCKQCNKAFTTKDVRSKYCNRKCSRRYHNTIGVSSSDKRRYAKAKSATNRAKSKQKLLLTLEEYILALNNSICFYCDGKVGNGGTGLDRIDSSRSYILSNVVACCRNCNTVKSNLLTKEEMFILIDILKELRNGSVWEKIK